MNPPQPPLSLGDSGDLATDRGVVVRPVSQDAPSGAVASADTGSQYSVLIRTIEQTKAHLASVATAHPSVSTPSSHVVAHEPLFWAKARAPDFSPSSLFLGSACPAYDSGPLH